MNIASSFAPMSPSVFLYNKNSKIKNFLSYFRKKLKKEKSWHFFYPPNSYFSILELLASYPTPVLPTSFPYLLSFKPIRFEQYLITGKIAKNCDFSQNLSTFLPFSRPECFPCQMSLKFRNFLKPFSSPNLVKNFILSIPSVYTHKFTNFFNLLEYHKNLSLLKVFFVFFEDRVLEYL